MRHHLWCICRKRISKEILQEINERIVKRQLEKKQTVVADDKNNDDENPSAGSGNVESPEKNGKEQPNRGNLLLDATCVPADIRFPTDLGVLNESREKL